METFEAFVYYWSKNLHIRLNFQRIYGLFFLALGMVYSLQDQRTDVSRVSELLHIRHELYAIFFLLVGAGLLLAPVRFSYRWFFRLSLIHLVHMVMTLILAGEGKVNILIPIMHLHIWGVMLLAEYQSDKFKAHVRSLNPEAISGLKDLDLMSIKTALLENLLEMEDAVI